VRHVESLLAELKDRDVRVWVEEGRLRYSAPKGALSPELLERLREQKPALMEYLQRARGAVRAVLPALEPVPRDGPLPLSFPQQRLWFLSRFQQDGGVSYNMPGALRLEGELDVDALEAAFAALVHRHESLRTRFPEVDGGPVQRILPEGALPLERLDLRGLAEPERAARLRERARQEAEHRFDLTQGPLARAVLARLEGRSHVLLLTLHHVIADAWSLGILFKELAELYAARVGRRAARLEALPVQYADFAVWQRQKLVGVLDAQREYWKKQLAGAPALLELPTDRPRPAVQTFRGATVPLTLDAALAAGVRALAERHGATPFMVLLAGFQALLSRYSGQEDLVVGSPVANRRQRETEGLIGFFVNMLALRAPVRADAPFRELLARVKEVALDAYANQDVPFEQLVEALQPERNLSHTPLFQVMFMLQNAPSGRLELPGLDVRLEDFESVSSKFDLTLSLTEAASGYEGWLEYNVDLYDEATARRMAGHLRTLLGAAVEDPERPVGRLPLLTAEELPRLAAWNDTRVEVRGDRCVHRQFEAQVARTPDAVAVVFRDTSLTYRELDARANRLAHHLRSLGAGPGALVGLCVERSLEMVVGMLGILKSGAAYLPLDPKVPAERLALVVEDARAGLLVTQSGLKDAVPASGARRVLLDTDWPEVATRPDTPPSGGAAPQDRAYVIYTSGSTGRPKGVELEHRLVTNFFAGMDGVLGTEPGTWLAVTTISFDISVLELLWTLSRGYRVVIQDDRAGLLPAAGARRSRRPVDFSLLYFASSSGGAGLSGRYRLLLEGARFADAHGFTAVWTPERHFHDFGDLYPNPSVTGAAVAAVTRRVRIRAGSVVLPLHDPLRVAEEWAVVDGLSDGRVDVSFASGWQAHDFVLAPERYAKRKERMLQGLEEVRRLWRGGTVRRVDGTGREREVQTRPRPVQPELPVWLTAAGSEETFRAAGEVGANVLTHLLGQGLEDLEKKVAAYHAAWREAGHAGTGKVTLMLHTFVGEDARQVLETVRGPFREYLRSSLDLLAQLARSLGMDLSQGSIAPEDLEFLLDHGFERFYETSGLFGTVEACVERVERLREVGVDEVACLIDFGVDPDTVLASLPLLDRVRALSQPSEAEAADDSVPAQVRRHAVTHLQCTPSLARLLAEDARGLEALRSLRALLLGGEELPAALLERLQEGASLQVLNMYGPTETTVWSTSAVARARGGRVSIGRPLANTQVHIVDRYLQPVPVGLPGELLIGGDGVARGYLGRPELTAERFLADPFTPGEGRRVYRTGDLARWRADGELEFLGRTDFQVKVRGFRIELGEIEAVLARHPRVRQCVVVVRADGGGEKLLVGYVVPEGEAAGAAELRRFLSQHLPDYMVPGLFVTLEELPRTPNGKIDRRALPAPDVRAGAQGERVLPRTTVEMQLAALWEELLKVPSPGVRDSFFALGGHSILAVQMMAHIERLFGRRLPLATLFRAPTIEQLAVELSRDEAAARPLLVELQKGHDGQPPVFCVPGAGGNLIYFHTLVRHLRQGRTVYGLQPVYSETLTEGTVVEDLAARYLAAVRQVQPHGPYAFVGHSFGGVIAFELACRLRKAGEEVALLGILDSHAPVPRRQPLGLDWDQAEWLRLIGSLLLRLYGKDVGLTVEELRRHAPDAQVGLLMERMQACGLLPPEADRTQFLGFVRTFQADQQSTYVPPEPYPGRITFFRAGELHPDNVPVEELRWTLEQPALGWERFSTQPVEVHVVPGDHLSMMTEPHVQELARRLAGCLQASPAEHPERGAPERFPRTASR
jgi:natural product biosynthesis luciferase-like monooxygenase protein